MSKFVTFADIVLVVSGFSHSAFFPSGQLIHRLEILTTLYFPLLEYYFHIIEYKNN